MPIYALLDCNNFYASCERLFNPKLINKPIVVLSNNDGCIIASSNEAKALGIPMGEPYFKAKSIIENNNVAVFSSNYTLYGDLSNRVMKTVASITEDIEVYSIDEVFINLTQHPNPEELSHHIRNTVMQFTGIPVSIGIANTKTLAKLANRIAKKYKAYQGVFYIDSDERCEKVLKATNVNDIWGIGRQLTKRLSMLGINTAYELTQMPDKQIRNSLSINGLKTMKELMGISCIEIEPQPNAKKMITVSRSFGGKVTCKQSVREAMANFTERACEKLRGEKQLVIEVIISLYRELATKGVADYKDTALLKLPYPTDSTLEIMKYVMSEFEELYTEGNSYRKCGVIFSSLIPKHNYLPDMFDPRDIRKQNKLMEIIDTLNKANGSNTIQIAASRGKGKWIAKKEQKSFCYTTRWSELPLAH